MYESKNMVQYQHSIMLFENLILCIIFIGYFQQSTKAQCNDVPYTFSFSEAVLCNTNKICSNRIIDSCYEDALTTSAKITSNVKVLRRGAFKNSPRLKYIKLDGVGLEEIEPKAFLNLTEACSISMANNSIKAIPSGVFSKSGIAAIDLYSNKISSIDDYAFAYMPYLQTLSMSGNLLHEIKENWFMNSTLRSLILSRNKFKVIRLSIFSKINKLAYLDLSFNEIIRVDVVPNLNIKLQKLYLCGNNLTNLRFLSSCTLKILCVSFNKISYVDDENLNSIASANVKEIYIHPNPWQCVCLRIFENTMRLRNITVVQPGTDALISWSYNYPVCIEGENEKSSCDSFADSDIRNAQDDYFKAVYYDQLINKDNYAFSDVSKFINLCRKYTIV